MSVNSTTTPSLAAKPGTTGVDPRSPRFGAGITAILLLVTIGLGLAGAQLPATILFAVITALFAWGALAGVKRHPYGAIYRSLVLPRLKPPTELEDPTPPTFAQGVGFFLTAVGLVLAIVVGPLAIVVAASLAFLAAFLNSVFAYCLGCQIYLLLVRTGVLGRNGATAA